MSPKSGNSKIKRQAKRAARNGEKYTQALRASQSDDIQHRHLASLVRKILNDPYSDSVAPYDYHFEIVRRDGRIERYTLDNESIFMPTMVLASGAVFVFAYMSGEGFTLTDPENEKSYHFPLVEYWTDRMDENGFTLEDDDGIGPGDAEALHDFYEKMSGRRLRKSLTGDESDGEYFELIANALIERSREVGNGSVKVADNAEYSSIASDGATEYELMFVLVSDNIRDDVQSAFEVAINDEFGVGLDVQVSQESDGVRLIVPVSPGTNVDEDILDGILQNVIQDVAPEGDISVEDRPEVLSVMVGESWSEEPALSSHELNNEWDLRSAAEALEFCTPSLENEETDTWVVEVDYYNEEGDLVEYLTDKYKVSVEIVNVESPYGDGSTIKVRGTHSTMIDFLADYSLGSDESAKESFRSIDRDDLLAISQVNDH